MNEELKKEWADELEELIYQRYDVIDSKANGFQDVKSFISFLLAKQQEEFVKMIPIPKMHSLPDGVNSPHETEHDRGWNDCIADIKSKLNI